MSDRYNGFVVTFEKPIKDEDAKNLEIALMSIKGVISVKPIVDDIASLCARSQIGHEFRKKLWKVMEEME